LRLFLGSEGNLNAAKNFERNKKNWQTLVVLDTWDGMRLSGIKSNRIAEVK